MSPVQQLRPSGRFSLFLNKEKKTHRKLKPNLWKVWRRLTDWALAPPPYVVNKNSHHAPPTWRLALMCFSVYFWCNNKSSAVWGEKIAPRAQQQQLRRWNKNTTVTFINFRHFRTHTILPAKKLLSSISVPKKGCRGEVWGWKPGRKMTGFNDTGSMDGWARAGWWGRHFWFVFFVFTLFFFAYDL